MDNLENIKIIKTIKKQCSAGNAKWQKFTTIIYIIDDPKNIDQAGKKYLEFWRTYDNYGEISLIWGIDEKEYKNNSKEYEEQALTEAYNYYINREF